jgi:hypothetical protein
VFDHYNSTTNNNRYDGLHLYLKRIFQNL